MFTDVFVLLINNWFLAITSIIREACFLLFYGKHKTPGNERLPGVHENPWFIFKKTDPVV